MKFLDYIPLLSTLVNRGTHRNPALHDLDSTGNPTPRSIQGLDISHHQSNPNLTEAHTVGLDFVFIKATEGPTYVDPAYAAHLQEATTANFLHGGYHVAKPDLSDGNEQASFFVSNGGGWSANSSTLPGLISIGMDGNCAGLTVKEMLEWLRAFISTYKGATGRDPVIGTSNGWWVQCTGNTAEFSEKSALLLANWGNSVGMVPGGWQFASFWQYKEGGAWGGNSNIFNGNADALKKLADG